MAGNKAHKKDLHDLARSAGDQIGELHRRVASLSIALDCLVKVTGMEQKLRAEINTRAAQATAERLAKEAATKDELQGG